MTGEEKQFTEALQHTPINKSTIDELKQVLKLAMLKVGIRANNLPNDIEKAVLIEHIINEYGKHTPMEIKLAFDMAIAGKLELEEKEVICYENFSCLYFSKIMNAYRQWAKETYSQYKQDQPKMIAEQTELSPIEMLDWIKDWQEANKDKIIIDLIPLPFYNFLVKTETIEVNDEMKWDYWEKALTVIGTELHSALPLCKTTNALKELAAFETMKKEKKYTDRMAERIRNKAKKLILFDYFRKK